MTLPKEGKGGMNKLRKIIHIAYFPGRNQWWPFKGKEYQRIICSQNNP